IRANGGNTYFGCQFGAVNSGAGSGGAIRLMAPRIDGTGTLNAPGGGSCANGGNGSRGRIRLEAFQHALTGSVDPAPLRASPFEVFLSTNQPSVRVVSVAGANVPVVPTG